MEFSTLMGARLLKLSSFVNYYLCIIGVSDEYVIGSFIDSALFDDW